MLARLSLARKKKVLYMCFICSYGYSTEELKLATGASAPIARKKQVSYRCLYMLLSCVIHVFICCYRFVILFIGLKYGILKVFGGNLDSNLLILLTKDYLDNLQSSIMWKR